jgi:AcrR family transcriptional regulator
MKTKPISEATRTAILDAAWKLRSERGRLDVSQSEIAAAAGVSRQTVYMAFGNRAGLLTEMTRNKDTKSDHVPRMRAVRTAATVSRADFEAYVNTYLDYLPLIYPVAILLDAASLTDEEAAAAWDDRMKGAVLAGIKQMFVHLGRDGHLAPGWTPAAAAELVWSLLHPTCWRLLVVGCGWSEEKFRRSRFDIIRAIVLAKDETGKKNRRRRR